MEIITNDNEKTELAIIPLKKVIDPEIGINVVDLGLIRQLDFDDAEKDIYCTMTLTTRFCPMGESISSGVRTALEESFPDYKIDLTLTFEPPWNSSMISQEGMRFLNGD
ncbi:MAG: metal-sulfur cluster assembly factor [Ginsengibacter sp.]